MNNDFNKNLFDLKVALNAKNDTQLAKKLELSYSAIDGWKRRKVIPRKYLNYIQNKDNVLKPSIDYKSEIIELLDELDDKKLEYYFHKIKSDILENEFK